MSSHALADLRSLELHRAVAERMREDPKILERARARVDSWRDAGTVHPYYCDAWRGVLARSVDEVISFLVRDDERARELRQASPFAGVLDARERWRLLRAMRGRE